MSEDDARFTISRVFNAPRALLWSAWTVPEKMAAWFGPKGTEAVRVIRHELKAGGVFLSAMKMPNGPEMCAKFVYREVEPISRLVWVHSFADEQGTVVRHPFSPNWPLELLTTVTFADLGDKTELSLEWLPLNAGPIEIQTFKDGKAGMQGGWAGTYDQLAEFLATG